MCDRRDNARHHPIVKAKHADVIRRPATSADCIPVRSAGVECCESGRNESGDFTSAGFDFNVDLAVGAELRVPALIVVEVCGSASDFVADDGEQVVGREQLPAPVAAQSTISTVERVEDGGGGEVVW